MDKSTQSFLIIFILMMATSLVLHWCAKMGLQDRDARGWDVHVITTAEACEVRITAEQDITATDETITINPQGKRQ